MHCARAPTPRCARRSFTTADTRSPRPRPTWPRPGSRSGSVDGGPTETAWRGAIVNDQRIDGGTVLERLRELPGVFDLLELAAAREDVELIGGAARDLLLGHMPRELDVVVDGAAEAFAD